MIMKDILEIRKKIIDKSASLDDLAKLILFLTDNMIEHSYYSDTDSAINDVKEILNVKFGKFGANIKWLVTS